MKKRMTIKTQWKKASILVSLALILILSFQTIAAFGVAIPYWDSPEWYPLKLAPGESKIVILAIQNTGDENMTVEATINNNEIATLEGDSIFFVPSGEVNKPAKIKVKIPKDAKVGTKYKVYASFQQISSGEGGMVSLSGALTINFPVEVVGEEESELFGEKKQKPIFAWIILGILLIGIIIINMVKNKKKRKRKS